MHYGREPEVSSLGGPDSQTQFGELERQCMSRTGVCPIFAQV